MSAQTCSMGVLLCKANARAVRRTTPVFAEESSVRQVAVRVRTLQPVRPHACAHKAQKHAAYGCFEA
jgi:hypothetical protein